MKSSKINQKFQTYVDSLGDASAFRKHPSDVAAIFGTDQFDIDGANSRIKLPEFGWVDLPRLPNPKTIGWVAVLKVDNDYQIAFGRRGVSPYSEEAGEFLPRVGGITLAMPFINYERIKDKMIAT